MPPENAFAWLIIPLEIVLVDLIVGGDNAFVIALSCRRLPKEQVRQAILYGTFAAILLRLVLTATASALIEIPFLKLVCAAVLLVIAVNVLMPQAGEPASPREPAAGTGLWSSIAIIVLADAIMGLDNIVALAAIAQGNILYLLIGLAFSVPMLVYGGVILAKFLHGNRLLVAAGGAVLGFVAGELAVGDAAIAPWVAAEAPALVFVVPLLGAIFVVAEGLLIGREEAARLDHPLLQDDRGGTPPKAAKGARRTPRTHPPFPPPLSEPAILAPAIGMRIDAPSPIGILPAALPAHSANQDEQEDPETQGPEGRLVLIGFLAMFAIAGLMFAVTLAIGGGLLSAGG